MARKKPAGKWVFVQNENLTPEQQEEQKMDEVATGLALFADPCYPFAAAEQFRDYFPGENKVPEGGAWVLVKNSPSTEYTVPPLSIWFAEPWYISGERHCSHRVKILTPKGNLGLFPREYSLISDPGKYFEFIGDGMEVRFFGPDEGVPKDKLFYLRSRGISKKTALSLLIGEIKAHGVLWMEATRKTCAQMGFDWPDNSRLATLK